MDSNFETSRLSMTDWLSNTVNANKPVYLNELSKEKLPLFWNIFQTEPSLATRDR